jgi:HAD superfamily hydrolase (TIGR01509 family)
MTPRHVIFDCDGVLVDSEPISMRADVEILKAHGFTISERDAHERFVGKTFQAMLDDIAANEGVSFPPGLSDQKNRMMEELYLTELRIVPGVIDVLNHLKRKGIGISIGSNSPKARVELALKLMGIAPYFSAITSVADVAEGKPAPDIFLRAAEIADVSPSDCMVVEDSTTGVTAAVAAKMRTLGFVGTHHEPERQAGALKKRGAFAVLKRMDSLPNYL